MHRMHFKCRHYAYKQSGADQKVQGVTTAAEERTSMFLHKLLLDAKRILLALQLLLAIYHLCVLLLYLPSKHASFFHVWPIQCMPCARLSHPVDCTL